MAIEWKPIPGANVTVNAVPQNTEADQHMSQAITPTVSSTSEAMVAAANVVIASAPPQLEEVKGPIPVPSPPAPSAFKLPKIDQSTTNWLLGAITAGIVAWGGLWGVHWAVDNLPTTHTTIPKSGVQILEAKAYYLRLKSPDGKIILRTGGNAGWRYHNPLKLVHGKFTIGAGDLGSDGKLAIFPDDATGRKAGTVALFESSELGFRNKTIEQAMTSWATAKDGYDPKKYARNVAAAAGVPRDSVMSSLTTAQRDKFVDQAMKEEQYAEGKETIFKDEEDWTRHGW